MGEDSTSCHSTLKLTIILQKSTIPCPDWARARVSGMRPQYLVIWQRNPGRLTGKRSKWKVSISLAYGVFFGISWRRKDNSSCDVSDMSIGWRTVSISQTPCTVGGQQDPNPLVFHVHCCNSRTCVSWRCR